MSTTLSTYQKFFSPEQAQPVTDMLRENNIPFELTRSKALVDTVIAGHTSFDNLYELKIAPAYFERVNQLLQKTLEVNMHDLGSDYYLFSFTDEELVDIVHKPDEWNLQDVAIAKQLLQQRGIEYSDDELAAIKNKRLHTLGRPERVSKRLLTGGYVCAFLLGLIGIFIGLAIWQAKKTLPNGKREYVYDHWSRGNGQFIFIISIVMVAVGIIGNRNDAAAGLITYLGGWLFRFI